jgi:hypothetical protein
MAQLFKRKPAAVGEDLNQVQSTRASPRAPGPQAHPEPSASPIKAKKNLESP